LASAGQVNEQRAELLPSWKYSSTKRVPLQQQAFARRKHMQHARKRAHAHSGHTSKPRLLLAHVPQPLHRFIVSAVRTWTWSSLVGVPRTRNDLGRHRKIQRGLRTIATRLLPATKTKSKARGNGRVGNARVARDSLHPCVLSPGLCLHSIRLFRCAVPEVVLSAQ
jgi:hypothetical protein